MHYTDSQEDTSSKNHFLGFSFHWGVVINTLYRCACRCE